MKKKLFNSNQSWVPLYSQLSQRESFREITFSDWTIKSDIKVKIGSAIKSGSACTSFSIKAKQFPNWDFYFIIIKVI